MIIRSRLDYDDPATWGCRELHTRPSFDVEGFQKELDKIFGMSAAGNPVVRLVWAPDIQKCYSKFGSEHSIITGEATKWELTAKYKYAQLKLDNGDKIDIPPPRWIIEDWESPARYAETWEATRWVNGKEMRPPPPMDGYYFEIMKIGSHDEQCCKDARAMKVVCWGKYRVPDQRDIEALKRAKFKRDAEAEIDLNAPLSEKTLASAARVANERIARKKMLADEQLREFVDENALELIEMFTGQKLSEKTKKFSVPAHFSKKESGLIAPV